MPLALLMIKIDVASVFSRIPMAIALGIILVGFGRKLIAPNIIPTSAITRAIDCNCVKETLKSPLALLMIRIELAKVFSKIPTAIALGIMLAGFGRKLISPNTTANSATTRAID